MKIKLEKGENVRIFTKGNNYLLNISVDFDGYMIVQKVLGNQVKINNF